MLGHGSRDKTGADRIMQKKRENVGCLKTLRSKGQQIRLASLMGRSSISEEGELQ